MQNVPSADTGEFVTLDPNIMSTWLSLSFEASQDWCEKPCRCTRGRKSFNDSSNFIRHQRIQAGKKPFVCPQCGKSFSFAWSSGLINHHHTHTCQKPYKCPQCQKSFIQRSKLKTHQQLHTGDQPFSCSQCEKRFNSRTDLTHHGQTHLRDHQE
ncbi:PREDICTED: zinc finger protein 391-like [Chaetura pelagica]|uniref:zinc finger protein 391-like n=1 Tax=Chaetura pelagica TaxID=8897 RepID=UPI0005231E1C|nr:PREDICTED: zinc finger protein 391-like [Chaetura pelagica]